MGHSTKDFFPAFKEEAEKWIQRFGLVSWRLEIMCQSKDEESELTDSRAICRAHKQGRISEIILNEEWPDWAVPSEQDVRRSAFHECCELLMMRLEWLAFDRTTTEEQYEEERHIVIRTLENAVFARECDKVKV